MSTSTEKIKAACLAAFKQVKNPQILTLMNEGIPKIRDKKLTITAFAGRAEKIDQELGAELLLIQQRAKALAMMGQGKKVFGAENIPKGQAKDWYFAGQINGKDVFVYNEDG